jgi:hypothetical protein
MLFLHMIGLLLSLGKPSASPVQAGAGQCSLGARLVQALRNDLKKTFC